MNNPPVMGVHGADGDRAPELPGFFAEPLGELHQRILAAGAVVFRVHDDGQALGEFLLEDLGYEILKGVQGLAPLSDEEAGAVAGVTVAVWDVAGTQAGAAQEMRV